MSRYSGEQDYRHDSVGCLGVLLVNLGSPDAPTTDAVRRYLAEFLRDPRVVEIPRPVWWLILHGMVLRFRPRRSAHAYQRVWTEDGSPLLTISRRQARAVQDALAARYGDRVQVALAMRYGKPSVKTGLAQLREAGARRILVLPLYPQYSAATTATVFDAVSDELKSWRWVPELRFITHYHDDGAYLGALVNSIRESWVQHGEPERLLFSFHGMPKRTLRAGDPYYCQCQKTARLVAERLGLPHDRWQVAFQSRFGRAEWLQPYTDKTLRQWARDGVKQVDVVCPGFAADCLETLEEIAMQNKETFLTAGGKSLRYIPALNERVDHIAALVELITSHLQGWLAADYDPSRFKAEAQASQRRARALGADQ
ncbi:MAG: ferrochelatase [Gammaproteobacteria bacterium]|jgi:ferrochelatase